MKKHTLEKKGYEVVNFDVKFQERVSTSSLGFSTNEQSPQNILKAVIKAVDAAFRIGMTREQLLDVIDHRIVVQTMSD